MNNFKITTDPNDLDFEVIYQFISTSYWAKGIPRTVLETAIANSLVFGLYKTSGEQVGFARVTTDKATFAYLADVFILPEVQGLGLGKRLVETIVTHPDLQGLRRFILATSDAHTLYEKFGFEAVDDPSILMQICQPNVYQ